MTAGKVIPDLLLRTPVVDAARRALSLRLERLRDVLGPATKSFDDEGTAVHDLRVACRRATAAVELFEVCLPKSVFKHARRRLKRYRRAAGEARDQDVWMAELGRRLQTAPAADCPGIDFLLGICLSERIPAQLRIEAVCSGDPFEYERWMSDLIGSLVSPRPDQRVADLVRDRLRPQFERFWQAARRPSPSWGELHETRIEAKRLRYGIELLANALHAESCSRIVAELSAAQEILGAVNDGRVGRERLQGLAARLPDLAGRHWSRWSLVFEQMIAEAGVTLDTGRARFEAWRLSAREDRFDERVRTLFSGSTEA